ncbi:hypothetical protein SUNI508_13745 [Seiridium unicorne]|uniref:Protein kinase domain-containing protein n=1 Tax=Seiridium unicorne TaxID=138068 RepID=A0ABR2VBL2_9PEZI
MGTEPNSGEGSVEWGSAEVNRSLAREEAPMSSGMQPSNPDIRYSLASSAHDDDLNQRNRTDRLSTEFRALGLPDKNQLSPDDDNYSSSSDFVSVINVNDFGFGDSWRIQTQKYGYQEDTACALDATPRVEIGPKGEDPYRSLDEMNLKSVGDQFPPTPPAWQASVRDFVQDLGDITETNPGDSINAEYLYEQLLEAQEHSKHGSSSSDDTFIPQDKLFTILSDYNIIYLLKDIFSNESSNQIRERAAQICSGDHCDSRRMILAILILIGKTEYIDDFIRHGICDVNLPLKDLRKYDTEDRSFPRKKPFHRRQDKPSADPLTSFAHWQPKEMQDFFKYQYEVLAPFFKIGGDRVCFYRIYEKMQLPFLEYHHGQGGGHGTVWKVKIHPAHHDFEGIDAGENPYFALKAIYSEEYAHIRDEVRVLERFSGSRRGHEHLIRLLMAFKHGRKYYLLFPWAAGNLADLWRRDPIPLRTLERTRWLLKQCFGVADGLKKIHHHGSWRRYEAAPSLNQDDLVSKSLGRHGDIKPENVLWFDAEGRLVVADFGLTRFHSTQAGSEITTPNNLRGFSRTYRPPEFSLEAPVSQKCDVWSLGCLYLEFITWYLVGYEKTRGDGPGSFSNLRTKDDDRTSDHLNHLIREDKFFNLKLCQDPHKEDGKAQYVADVKESVKKWITYLRELEQCSKVMEAFLDMIETEMLVPDTYERADMHHVQLRLKSLRDDCQDNDDPCSNHARITSVRRRSRAQPAVGELRRSIVTQGPTRRDSPGTSNGDDRHDLDTLILGLLENANQLNSSATDASGLSEPTVHPDMVAIPTYQSPVTARKRSTDLKTASTDRPLPRFLPEETKYTVVDSQLSTVEMTSSFATSIVPTGRNSNEIDQNVQRPSMSSVLPTIFTTNSMEGNKVEKDDGPQNVRGGSPGSGVDLPMSRELLEPRGVVQGQRLSQGTRDTYDASEHDTDDGSQLNPAHDTDDKQPRRTYATAHPALPGKTRWHQRRDKCKRHLQEKWRKISTKLRRPMTIPLALRRGWSTQQPAR